jgi:hypothetical protein
MARVSVRYRVRVRVRVRVRFRFRVRVRVGEDKGNTMTRQGKTWRSRAYSPKHPQR